MSPLNSNKLKNFHFTTSQNNVTITVQKCSVFFSSCFQSMYWCTVYFTKNVCSFFFFFFHMLCSTMFKFLLFFSSVFFFLLSCTFLFLFSFSFYFFFLSFFFHNKLLIQCPLFFFFFQPYMYLSVFTLTR